MLVIVSDFQGLRQQGLMSMEVVAGKDCPVTVIIMHS